MKGKREFERNLNRALKAMRAGATRGLQLGVALIKGESQDRSPVDLGNLKGSHYTNVEIEGRQAVGEVGLTADYAHYVHEGVEKNFTVGEAKFLENAVNAKKDEVMKLIQEEAKV